MKKKHKLLKYAYDNYPKGSVARFKGIEIDHTSTGVFKIQKDEDNVCVVSGNGVECFYSDGKWAEIVDKKPILVSEDGVELFEGDDCFIAKVDAFSLKWYLFEHSDGEDETCFGVSDNGLFVNLENQKNFSTKEAAEKWIEEHNKPKEVEIELYGSHKIAKVALCGITIENKMLNSSIGLTPSDVEDIHNALKTLTK